MPSVLFGGILRYLITGIRNHVDLTVFKRAKSMRRVVGPKNGLFIFKVLFELAD